MKTIHRIWELASIMIVVWIMMMAMIVVIDKVVVPMKIPVSGWAAAIIDATFKLIISGVIAGFWLWLWIMLVQKYVERNKG